LFIGERGKDNNRQEKKNEVDLILLVNKGLRDGLVQVFGGAVSPPDSQDHTL